MSRQPSTPGLEKRLASAAAGGLGVSPAIARLFTTAGNKAKKRGDWPAAASHYARSLSIHEPNAQVQVQYGNALRETGRLPEAVAAYRRATALNPTLIDGWNQLSRTLKRMGDAQGATETLREALVRNPGATNVRDELISIGGRGQVPAELRGQAAAAVESARLTKLLSTGVHGLADLVTVASFPQGDHNGFRSQYPIQPPPDPAGGTVRVRIASEGATPAHLRATLMSLIDQRHQAWTAHVVSAGDLAGHSVASYAHMDPRIRFAPLDRGETTPVVLISAGDRLDREALGWLTYALDRTSAAAVYGDHDHYSPDWRAGPVQHSPQLQPMFDLGAMRASSSPPAIAIVADAGSLEDDTTVLTALAEASSRGQVAHLPRLLTSRPADRPSPPTTEAAGQESDKPGTASILVVVPTRDEAEMLDRCVRSLIARATQPERLRIVIVDNRSESPETKRTLARLKTIDGVEALALDEPFNWPRCNNGAVKGRDGELLVFANNDMEMLSDGWDDALRLCLNRPEVGVVGARLLYPDGGVQHAGILLGTWEDRPSHDGLWVGADEEGPLRRWKTTHYAAAVTGAFLACRRDIFEQIGGFDERLSIAYNDIDFCLKARERGLKVVYCPRIELTHYESRTRGHNDSPEKVAWDDAELSDMHQRWGTWLFHDPSYNPQWAMAVNRPYDGIRDLALSRVLGHLDASAAADPWAITRDVSRT